MSPSQDLTARRDGLGALDWDGDLICISDTREGRIEMASTALRFWSGWTLPDLQRLRLGDLIHAEDQARLIREGAQIVRFRRYGGTVRGCAGAGYLGQKEAGT